ncbi:MAG: hypothetical protein ACRC1W_05110 [Shewanella sp.]
MALSRREKSEINQRLIDIKKELNQKGDTLSRRERSALTREWGQKLKLLGRTARTDSDKGSSLIDDYVAGNFNSLTIDLFLIKIDEVAAAGGTLEQIKSGAQAWVIGNASRFNMVDQAA